MSVICLMRTSTLPSARGCSPPADRPTACGRRSGRTVDHSVGAAAARLQVGGRSADRPGGIPGGQLHPGLLQQGLGVKAENSAQCLVDSSRGLRADETRCHSPHFPPNAGRHRRGPAALGPARRQSRRRLPRRSLCREPIKTVPATVGVVERSGVQVHPVMWLSRRHHEPAVITDSPRRLADLLANPGRSSGDNLDLRPTQSTRRCCQYMPHRGRHDDAVLNGDHVAGVLGQRRYFSRVGDHGVLPLEFLGEMTIPLIGFTCAA